MQKYNQNEPNFNGFYSRNKLPKKKDGAYGVNPDEFKLIWSYWIALYVNAENITYFGSNINSFSIQIYFLLINKKVTTKSY